jgi:hypothetical protein
MLQGKPRAPFVPSDYGAEQVGSVVVPVRHDVRSAVDQSLFQTLVRLLQFGPMNPGLVFMFEVIADVVHREVEEPGKVHIGVTHRPIR